MAKDCRKSGNIIFIFFIAPSQSIVFKQK